MGKIVGVRFKPAGKIYDFDAGVFVLRSGDRVVVETEQGLSLGLIAVPPRDPGEGESPDGLKKVFRMAGDDDFQQAAANADIEAEAHRYCQACIEELGLVMNHFRVESSFDGSKLTFFFTADGRVDFRQLVKMLVKRFRVRIEMRQVGVRHQAKMCGGLGRCGRTTCCSTFMENFDPVSIRMAKEQNLSLNPTKISGLCGRLMCCLNFENETYKSLKKQFPKIGKAVKTPSGTGKVVRLNPICGRIAVRQDGLETEFALDDVQIISGGPDKGPDQRDRKTGKRREKPKDRDKRKG